MTNNLYLSKKLVTLFVSKSMKLLKIDLLNNHSQFLKIGCLSEFQTLFLKSLFTFL